MPYTSTASFGRSKKNTVSVRQSLCISLLKVCRQMQENVKHNTREQLKCITRALVLLCRVSLYRPHLRCLLLLSAILQITLSSSALSSDPLTISVSQTPLSLPFFVAEKLGYFNDSGVSVKIRKVIGGHRAMQEVLDGKSDLGTSSDSVVMFNSFQSSDFAILATFVTSTYDVKIISRTGTAVDTARHLEGKVVGTVLGSASHYYLDTFLLLNGVDPDAVEKHSLQPETMAKSLNNGDVDAVAIWEPHPFEILHTVSDTQVISDPGIYWLTFNLIVNKKHLGGRDDDLAKLLGALERAQQYIANHPLEAKDILRVYLQLEGHFVDWVWPNNNYHLGLEQSLLTTLESEARWAQREGYVKGRETPNYLDFIYSGPLKKTNSAAVTLIE